MQTVFLILKWWLGFGFAVAAVLELSYWRHRAELEAAGVRRQTIRTRIRFALGYILLWPIMLVAFAAATRSGVQWDPGRQRKRQLERDLARMRKR